MSDLEAAMNADRLNEIRERVSHDIVFTRADEDVEFLLAALDAAEQRAADAEARYCACCEEREEVKRLTTYKTIGELQARAVQAEQERDELKVWLDRGAAQLAAAEARLAETEEALLSAVKRFPRTVTEARLAETQKAIQAALNELGVPDADYPAPIANAVQILRAALTTHPAEEKV